eukprot:8489151-Alexandrium_andersonii.AAC.1
MWLHWQLPFRQLHSAWVARAPCPRLHVYLGPRALPDWYLGLGRPRLSGSGMVPHALAQSAQR